MKNLSRLDKFLMTISFIILFYVAYMLIAPKIYHHIYNQGWDDAEAFYGMNKKPPEYLLKKNTKKKDEIEI